MGVTVFEHSLFAPLFGDAETAAVFAPDHTLALYNTVELALTRALAANGLADHAAAERVAALLADFRPDMDALAVATLRDGIPLPGYVKALKAAAGDDAVAVHKGSTSQDIMDTALVLALRSVNAMLETRLGALIVALGELADRFGDRPLMGRTRMQAALPVTVRHRIKEWRTPLAREVAALEGLRPRLEVLQFGGPVGTREGWEGKGDAVARHMAAALGLADPGAAWHTERGNLAAYAAWLAAVSAALGKIGADVALMAQQGIGEIRLAGGGGSSAMAHKANPIAAELLVTLARFTAAGLGGFAQSAVHEQERSGTAWALEWMILPQMCVATGAGLATALRLVAAVEMMGSAGSTP
ncbi:3-carboxy-cis,cis-muconate cycloisomerase [Acuticoccus mangrovi]|uniref:3-carboxy-cis,cis-muconate cycloisomerase n=1 Tax=Acuticoccus mangrovi TaxID=2796142 RepID=A0A934IN49_9HYPH|nr:3-carboxy-cis,cis-muconate cycloisomerase [Acuticoccus mangrovi]MBJ3775433.1 3-carboxy-cis,cis-muconate cycloisomerase [Acuticoccus mangrovi]